MSGQAPGPPRISPFPIIHHPGVPTVPSSRRRVRTPSYGLGRSGDCLHAKEVRKRGCAPGCQGQALKGQGGGLLARPVCCVKQGDGRLAPVLPKQETKKFRRALEDDFWQNYLAGVEAKMAR
jgi:hypothetical protein